MNRVSLPAVVAALFMVIALVSVAWLQDWDRSVPFAVVSGLCAITSALLALRDR
jgi:hypothetical protein